MAVGTQMAEKETDQARDTEITLSTTKLLGMFFALVIICGVFFTMGYLLGKSSSAGGRTEIIATSPSSSTAGKPSGANKTPEAVPSAPAATDTSTPAKAPDQPAAQQPAANASQNPSTPSPAANTSDGAPGSFMVQVAAVSKQEDADILVSSLQKKQYPVFIASSPGDPLFHVQVGPFSDKKDADAMKTRLAGDGYNAIVK
jgi:cell division septation protein DedD